MGFGEKLHVCEMYATKPPGETWETASGMATTCKGQILILAEKGLRG